MRFFLSILSTTIVRAEAGDLPRGGGDRVERRTPDRAADAPAAVAGLHVAGGHAAHGDLAAAAELAVEEDHAFEADRRIFSDALDVCDLASRGVMGGVGDLGIRPNPVE